MDQLKDLAVTTVAAAPSPATSGTSLTVATTHGSRFPAVPFNATVYPAAVPPDPSNAEIVRVTARTGDVLTVTRAQEGTTARSIVVGDRIHAAPGRRHFAEITENPVLDTAYVGLGAGSGAAVVAEINAQLQRIRTSPAGGGAFTLPAGVITLAGGPILVPSKVNLKGLGAGITQVTQSTASQPVIVSETWVSTSGGTTSGHCGIESLTVNGATGTNAHGIVLRDFYSWIRNVLVNSQSGDGILVTAANNVGTEVTGTLVENRYENVQIFNSAGFGFHNANQSGKCTDAWVSNLKVGGSASAAGGVSIEHGAGWQLSGVHTYGPFSLSGIYVDRLFATSLSQIYVEAGWADAGIRLNNVQQGSSMDNWTIFAENHPAGRAMLAITKQGGTFSAGDGMNVGDGTLVCASNTAVTGVTWDDTAGGKIRGGTLQRQGAFKGQITATGGAGAASVVFLATV